MRRVALRDATPVAAKCVPAVDGEVSKVVAATQATSATRCRALRPQLAVGLEGAQPFKNSVFSAKKRRRLL